MKYKATNSTGFSVDYVVVCESAAKEVTGKDVLVGAVPDGLMSPAFPMRFRCALWVVILADHGKEGRHEAVITLHQKGNVEQVIAKFGIQFSTSGISNGRNAFNTLPVDVIVNEPVTATLSWSIDGSSDQALRDISFLLLPDTKITQS